jgi:hypothetical protein
MKWFDKWITNRAGKIAHKQMEEKEMNYINQSPKSARLGVDQGGLDSPSVRFKMFKASGGTIIETQIYDERKDRHVSGLYVITNDKNIGEEINKILTMESLKV